MFFSAWGACLRECSANTVGACMRSTALHFPQHRSGTVRARAPEGVAREHARARASRKASVYACRVAPCAVRSVALGTLGVALWKVPLGVGGACSRACSAQYRRCVHAEYRHARSAAALSGTVSGRAPEGVVGGGGRLLARELGAVVLVPAYGVPLRSRPFAVVFRGVERSVDG